MPTPIADMVDIDDRLANAELGARVKVCGITESGEIDLLGNQQVDFVGLWYGVPGGPADLPLDTWRRFGAEAAATGSLAPVMVTFLKEVEAIREALDDSPVHWVQLHGYQTPGFVRAVKAISPAVRVIKVLHVRGGACIEERLIGSYEKAGVDVFLFDAVSEDGRVGSTGQTLDPELVASLAEGLTRTFLLDGGITAETRQEFAAVATKNR
jgi:phosphoribosylanthranilate isomerase